MRHYSIFFIILFLTSFAYSKPAKMIFIEQIYQLYESNLQSNQNNHKRNIVWLEESLKLPNRHPSQAIIITEEWSEYRKYKLLLRFHIHFLLTREYMKWGWQFDKKTFVFYNREWAEEILESLKIAKTRYEIADHYWKETLKWSEAAYDQMLHIGWEKIEDLNYQIQNDIYEYDLGEMIELRMQKADEKIKQIEDYLATLK